MSYDPIDDQPEGQWIVYGETGAVIGTYGLDEYRAKEAARACGGKDRGISAVFKEQSR